MQITKIGIMSDGQLKYVGELDSQVTSIDGPALWDDLEAAKSAADDWGGLAEGEQFVAVTISTIPVEEVTYQVLVGNVGAVVTTNDFMTAWNGYEEYVNISKSRTGRAGGESVTLLRGDEVVAEHLP